MSLSWTPFLNDFFSCLLLALLFSCHSLARVSSLLLGNALFHPLWVRSFVIHHAVLDQHPSRYSGSQASLPCRRQSSFIDRSSGFLSFSPSSSILAMFAQTVGFSWSCVRSTASLRLRTLFHVLLCSVTRSTWLVFQHHTLQSSSALGRHSFPSNYNTACLLACSPHLMKQRVCLLNCFVFCSFSSTLW